MLEGAAPPTLQQLPADDRPLDAFSLLVWLGLQVAAIAACERGLRWSATWPAEPRLAAVAVLLAVQIIALSLTFPRMLRSAAAAALVAASGLPMIALAGRLAGAPWSIQLAAILMLAAWIAALWPWAVWSRQPGRAGLAVAAAGLVVLGLPLLVYLQTEFGLQHWAILRQIHPLAGSAAIESLHFPPPATWLVFGLICGIGAILVGPHSNTTAKPATK